MTLVALEVNIPVSRLGAIQLILRVTTVLTTAYRLSKNGASDPGNLGNAKDWNDSAASKKFPVNDIPAVGAIAQWEANAGYASSSGHVAYVEKVEPDYIVITEDNYGLGYTAKYKIEEGSSYWPSNFIHIKDVKSSESQDTGPFMVSSYNKLWLAGVNEDGLLMTRYRPQGGDWVDWSHHQSAGYWSTMSKPALATAPDGTLWLAAITAEGTLLMRAWEPATGWFDEYIQQGESGAWSTTASPALAVAPSGRVWLAAVDKYGTIKTRSCTPNQGDTPAGGWYDWSTAHYSSGYWSTNAAPALTVSSNGTVWLAGVSKAGSILMHAWLPSANPNSGWTSWVAHGEAGSWATNSSPALHSSPNDRLWLAAITKDANLLVRMRTWEGGIPTGGWSGWSEHKGVGYWSREASPALVSTPDDRLWLAGISKDGSLVSRWWASGLSWTEWDEHRAASGWSERASPTLATDFDGNIWIGGFYGGGSLWLRSRDASWNSDWTRHGVIGEWE